jgi:hypothetical protein
MKKEVEHYMDPDEARRCIAENLFPGLNLLVMVKYALSGEERHYREDNSHALEAKSSEEADRIAREWERTRKEGEDTLKIDVVQNDGHVRFKYTA